MNKWEETWPLPEYDDEPPEEELCYCLRLGRHITIDCLTCGLCGPLPFGEEELP